MMDRRESDRVLDMVRDDIRIIREVEIMSIRDDIKTQQEKLETGLGRLEDKLERAMERMDAKFLWLIGGILSTLMAILSDRLF